MTNPRLAVSASVVRYLLALDALKSSGGIRTIDVARHLNVKKPSAHTMLNNLRDAGILTKDELGIAHLTSRGMELTSRYRRYYCAVASALARSLPPSADVKNAACTLVAELSEQVLEELCAQGGTEGHAVMKNPDTEVVLCNM